jgi:hypothetical protein
VVAPYKSSKSEGALAVNVNVEFIRATRNLIVFCLESGDVAGLSLPFGANSRYNSFWSN